MSARLVRPPWYRFGVWARAYEPTGLPITYIIGSDDVITKRINGIVNEGSLEFFLRSLLPDSR